MNLNSERLIYKNKYIDFTLIFLDHIYTRLSQISDDFIYRYFLFKRYLTRIYGLICLKNIPELGIIF